VFYSRSRFFFFDFFDFFFLLLQAKDAYHKGANTLANAASTLAKAGKNYMRKKKKCKSTKTKTKQWKTAKLVQSKDPTGMIALTTASKGISSAINSILAQVAMSVKVWTFEIEKQKEPNKRKQTNKVQKVWIDVFYFIV
jgi:hypothetical protein